MMNLRKLGATVVLTFALGLPVFAGQIDTPPCTEPEGGQTSTPPCSVAPSDMGAPTETSTAPGDMGTSTVADNETYFTEIVAGVLLNALPLF